MENPVVLRVDGAVESPADWSLEELRGLPEAHQVEDVTRFHAKRPGDGVALEAILERARPLPEADYLTLHAEKDDFHVSVPLQAVRAEGVVVYRHGDGPLSPQNGGPVRFMIRDPSACHSSELDDCANVKYLSRIELTVGKGLDTRPADDAEHEALHADESDHRD